MKRVPPHAVPVLFALHTAGGQVNRIQQVLPIKLLELIRNN